MDTHWQWPLNKTKCWTCKKLPFWSIANELMRFCILMYVVEVYRVPPCKNRLKNCKGRKTITLKVRWTAASWLGASAWNLGVPNRLFFSPGSFLLVYCSNWTQDCLSKDVICQRRNVWHTCSGTHWVPWKYSVRLWLLLSNVNADINQNGPRKCVIATVNVLADEH